MMIWVDFAILAVIGISTLVSLIRGFVKEAVSLIIWIGAFFIASTFYGDLKLTYSSLANRTILIKKMCSI